MPGGSTRSFNGQALCDSAQASQGLTSEQPVTPARTLLYHPLLSLVELALLPLPHRWQVPVGHCHVILLSSLLPP